VGDIYGPGPMKIARAFFTFRVSRLPSGLRYVTGQLTVHEGEKNLLGFKHLCLEIGENRRLPFILLSSNSTNGIYEIQGDPQRIAAM
jgi:hypothetical protein